MKRLHLFFFPIILALALTACGSSTSTTSGSSYGNTSPTPTFSIWAEVTKPSHASLMEAISVWDRRSVRLPSTRSLCR